MIKNKLVLIDAYAVIFRAFHAMPPFTDKKGRPVGAVYGFVTALFSAIKELDPEYLAVGIDVGTAHRISDYEQYKAHRPPAPDDLKAQVPIVKEVLKALNIPIFGVEGFEGEDVIATIVAKIRNPKVECRIESIIVTGDMDTLQLIDDCTKVYSMARGASQAVMYDTEKVKERYGLLPSQFVDYKALKGDPSDNIPGVPGIGEKTASNLIQNFNSLDNLYNQIAKLLNCSIAEPPLSLPLSEGELEGVDLKNIAKNLKISEKVLRLLIENKDLAFLSQKLSKIRSDVPIEFNLEDAKISDYDKNKAVELFQELGFKSLIARLPEPKKPDVQQRLF